MNPEKALAFILDHQEQNGSWKDYMMAVGESDGWVSGYVGTMVAPFERAAALRAWEYLKTVQKGGWGYNSYTPNDGDSTIWALKLASALGFEDSEEAKRAQEALKGSFTPEGGITTYGDERALRRILAVKWYDPVTGWYSLTHDCVTAAGAAFLPEASSYLESRQQNDGSWVPYWWCDRAYVTALSAEILHETHPEQANHAIEWALNRWQSERDELLPWNLAWFLRLLSLDIENQRATIEAILERLAELQQEDGSWQGSAWLRIPPADEKNPEAWQQRIANPRIHEDIKGLLTTATLVNAIWRLYKQGVVSQFT